MAVYQHDNQGKCDWTKHNQVANELDVRLEMPYIRSSIMTGFALTTGASNKIKWATGDAIVAGTKYSPAASSGLGTNNAFNWVYLNSSGVVSVATTKPSGNYAMVGVAQASGNAIIKARALRMRFPDLDGTGQLRLYGNLIFATDNANDIGASGATRPRTAYVATSLVSPLMIGGSGVTQTLTLRSTSGVGAAGADIVFQVGNNGATEAMRILNNGNVGIGTTGPNQKLEVKDGNLRLNNGYAELFNTGVKGWRMLISDGAAGDLAFQQSTAAGGSTYATKVTFDPNGNVGIGTTGPDALLELDQGAADGVIRSLTSSDVAHGLTSGGLIAASTDNYLTESKLSATLGGVLLQSLAENPASAAAAMRLAAFGGEASTTPSTTATALAEIYAAEHDGANALINAPANSLIFGVTRRVAGAWNAAFFVDAEGDLHVDGSATVGTFDRFDDVMLARAFTLAQSPKQAIQSRWDQFVHYNRRHLIEAGLLSDPQDGGEPMWCVTQHVKFLNDGFWQLGTRLFDVQETQQAIQAKMQRYERALVSLGVDPTALN